MHERIGPNERLGRRHLLAWTVSAMVLLLGPLGSVAHAASGTAFSGRATGVQGSALGIPIGLADTGDLPSSGGAQDATLLTASVPGVLSADVLHAATVGQGNQSSAEASVADLQLTVGGNTISADFLMARATAKCNGGQASASGSSEILGLTVNGQSISVSGSPNQTVALPNNGKVVINEQSGSTNTMTVNALHVIVPGVADIIVSSAHADITCGGGNCSGTGDFVTGGGVIPASGSKGNFAVAGGIKNGAFWGHLTYIDHGTGLKVKGTGVTVYTVTGATTRHIEGTAEVNGQPGFTYRADVADNGEPGRADTFALALSNGYTASGTLTGGNIQLHKPCH